MSFLNLSAVSWPSLNLEEKLSWSIWLYESILGFNWDLTDKNTEHVENFSKSFQSPV